MGEGKSLQDSLEETLSTIGVRAQPFKKSRRQWGLRYSSRERKRKRGNHWVPEKSDREASGDLGEGRGE